MNIPIFLSRPSPHLNAQVGFIDALTDALASRGFEPLTLGPGSGYDYEAPLSGIRRLLMHSCGLVSIAFRRMHAPSATRFLGADIAERREEPINNVWLTSPYCQIEPAMAFQLGLPILILRENGVLAEGVLETGVTGLYLPQFDLDDLGFISSQASRGLLDQWGNHVRTVHRRRGDPPMLFA